MHIAMPMPPPMHSVARPFLASRFCISCSSVTSTRAPDAPIGWPIAIAPPLTLTFEVSQPRSLLTAQACAAKASLASIRSRSPIVPAGLLQRGARGRDRAGAHDLRIDAGLAPRHDARRAACWPSLAACLAVISTTAAAPSLMPEALPAVTVPSFSKAGFSLAIASMVAPWRGYSSVSTMMSPLRVLMVTGTISSLNLPAFCAASALFCEATANSSCCCAGDLVLPGDVLGGVAHVVAVEGVPQPVLDHGVDEFDVAHLDAAAQILRVRGHAHRFLAAGDDDVGIAVEQRLIAERDGAQARAAELVDAPGRAFHRNAGGDRGLAGRVLALRRGQDLAHDHFGDAARLDAGALQRGLDGDGAEIVGRRGGEGAVETSDRGAGGADDDDIV